MRINLTWRAQEKRGTRKGPRARIWRYKRSRNLLLKQSGIAVCGSGTTKRQDLLRPSRLVNGYRVYDEDSINTLRFLRQAQTLGITLKEIKQLLELTNAMDDDRARPCANWRTNI